MRVLKIENPLLKIFVDDVNGVFSTIEKGTQYIDGHLRFNAQKAKEDENKSDDEVTMNVIKDIANEIDDMIDMTVDVPSNYASKRVPMLDLEVWIDENSNEINYAFYEKVTKCPYVISKNSAMSTSKKMECLSQEVFRRLHNTRENLHNDEIIDIMNKFMLKLKMSGYNCYDRYQILTSGYNHFEKLKAKAEHGLRPFYRNKNFQKTERKREKSNKKTNW